jgi:hypothetical protein
MAGSPARSELSAFPQPTGANQQHTDDAHLLQFEIDFNVTDALSWYASRLASAGYTVEPPQPVPAVFPARTLDFTTPATAGGPGRRGSLLLTGAQSRADHSVVLVVIE